jgi:hypothetical protein
LILKFPIHQKSLPIAQKSPNFQSFCQSPKIIQPERYYYRFPIKWERI